MTVQPAGGTISPAVLPIQRVVADPTPSAWRDGLVLRASGDEAVIAFLDGAVRRLQVVGPAVEFVAGEPVAYHPVAELVSASRVTTTARAV